MGLVRLTTLVALCAFFIYPAFAQEFEEDAKAGYTNSLIDGIYSLHDEFALPDGAEEYRIGVREFDGIDRCGVIEVNGVPLYVENYDVKTDGTFKYDNGAYLGSVGMLGKFLVHSRRALKDEDPRVNTGYVGFRLALARSTAATKATFKGTYSYHALYAFPNKDWRTIFGGLVSDGLGVFVFSPEGFPYSYFKKVESGIHVKRS